LLFMIRVYYNENRLDVAFATKGAKNEKYK